MLKIRIEMPKTRFKRLKTRFERPKTRFERPKTRFSGILLEWTPVHWRRKKKPELAYFLTPRDSSLSTTS